MTASTAGSSCPPRRERSGSRCARGVSPRPARTTSAWEGCRLQVSEATVEITPRGEPTWREHGGLVDALLLDVSATGVAGAYDVTATVRAPNGRSVTGAATFQLSPSGGEAQVVVPSALVKTLAVDGPYVVESLEVHDRTEGARTLRARYTSAWRTREVRLDQLE